MGLMYLSAEEQPGLMYKDMSYPNLMMEVILNQYRSELTAAYWHPTAWD